LLFYHNTTVGQNPEDLELNLHRRENSALIFSLSNVLTKIFHSMKKADRLDTIKR